MAVNVSKTKATCIGSKQKLSVTSNENINLAINGQQIKESTCEKVLAFYIYTTEISQDDNATIAFLESETFNTAATSSGKICFTFWYHMFGIHVQNLTVTVGGSQKFEKIGNQSQEWHCGVIDVTDQSGKIAFSAYRSELPYSVIALDYFQIV
ncbi:unnamed protein product [Mytilus coruscus]|uniref:MAM domain-containing protein n=1 Tax=Mytilus coruscus TaxID=42192 RepID=A0A6J8CVT0_MYTCO|nr:unnamed protein product [Mytilus coruscus]